MWTRPANGRRRYNVTSSLIGWARALNNPRLPLNMLADMLPEQNTRRVEWDLRIYQPHANIFRVVHWGHFLGLKCDFFWHEHTCFVPEQDEPTIIFWQQPPATTIVPVWLFPFECVGSSCYGTKSVTWWMKHVQLNARANVFRSIYRGLIKMVSTSHAAFYSVFF